MLVLPTLALLGCLVLLTACGQQVIAPSEINPDDMCGHCKMAISEKQYAAQFVTKDGDVLKFDDIVCMRSYLTSKQERSQVAAQFVTDYEARKWLKAEDAHYVKADDLGTPMTGNIVAFQTRAQALAAATRHQGRELGFADVFGR